MYLPVNPLVTFFRAVAIERYYRTNSVVALHDCMPTVAYVARRDFNDKNFATYHITGGLVGGRCLEDGLDP